MELLKLQTNIPVTAALKYSDGKRVTSNIEGAPDQLFFSLADGRGAYWPLVVGEKLAQLGIRAGQPFQICKSEVALAGGKRSIQYTVDRTEIMTVPAPKAELVAPPTVAAQPSTYAAPSVQQTHGNNALALAKAPLTMPSPSPSATREVRTVMHDLGALALEVCMDFEKQARAVFGEEFTLSEEAIKTTWTSLFMQYTRDRGGLQWPF